MALVEDDDLLAAMVAHADLVPLPLHPWPMPVQVSKPSVQEAKFGAVRGN